jgi:hypothetical protein
MVDMLKVLSIRTVDALVESGADDKKALRNDMRKTITAYEQLHEFIREGKAVEEQAFWLRYMDRAHTFLDKSGLGAKRLRHR